MSENYKIITDEAALRSFIDWLPDLTDGECFYVCLFSRSKYDSTNVLKSDKQQLGRFTSTKEYLFDKIKKLECEIGSYKQKGNPVPQESRAVYITPNPRSYEKATKESLKKFADLVTKPYSNYNPHQEVLSQIQVCYSRKPYMDFDFDSVNYIDVRNEIIANDLINIEACTFLQTRGGFHLLIKLDEIEKEFVKNWYNNIVKLSGVDVRGDNLIPCPGCTQGLFTPILIK